MAQKLKTLSLTVYVVSLLWAVVPATAIAAPASLQGNPIVKDLNDIVNVLSGLVGVVVVGVIILGGLQYSMAGDKAEAVSAAKKRIINGLIALVVFILTYAFLQWLIPGGVFG